MGLEATRLFKTLFFLDLELKSSRGLLCLRGDMRTLASETLALGACKHADSWALSQICSDYMHSCNKQTFCYGINPLSEVYSWISNHTPMLEFPHVPGLWCDTSQTPVLGHLSLPLKLLLLPQMPFQMLHTLHTHYLLNPQK